MLEHDGSEIALRSRKARALVTYLALERSTNHSRAKLCHLLWPESDENRARASLRQCLTTIRDALGTTKDELLDVDPDCIALCHGCLSIDLDAFFADLEAGETCVDTIARSATVAELLTDFEMLGDPFRSWILSTRQSILTRLSEALRAAYDDNDRGVADRLVHAQAARRIDPFDEGAVRACMQCEVERNNHAAALRIYGDFFDLLEREMDAEPATATQELAVAIKLTPGPAQTTSMLPPRLPATANAGSAQHSTIAVLPFEVYGPNPDERFLQVGVMEHITCHLASFHAPSVISSNTTRRYLGSAPRPEQVGAELNARYVLAGSLRFDGAAACLVAQLIRAADERVLWATTRACTTQDLMALNVPIAEEIARAIVPTVDAEELRCSRALKSDDLEPYHLVLQAKDLIFKLVRDDFEKAGKLLRCAVDIGPHFSPAHAMLADWYSINLWEGWSDDRRSDRAKLDLHARKAISLSPRDGRVLALWAHNCMMFDREYDMALGQLRKAIELCPNDSETLAWSVPTLTNTRNSEAAVRNAKKAISLSPFDPFIFRNEHFLSFALYVNGDYDESIECARSCFKRAPNYQGNIRVMIAALCAAGRKQETIDLVEYHGQVAPDFSVTKFQKIQGLRDPQDREVFASHLLSAGLAP